MRHSFIALLALLLPLSVSAQEQTIVAEDSVSAVAVPVDTLAAMVIEQDSIVVEDSVLVLDSVVVEETEVEQKVEVDPFRFGYFSYSAILKAMPEYAQAMADLNELKKVYDKEVASSEEELNKRFSEYIDGQTTFPENILLKRQKELQMLINQSIEFKKEAQRLLTDAEEKLLQPLHSRLREALAQVGADRKFSFILNTDNNACPFVNPEQGEDITDLVLTLLIVKK